MKSEYINKTTFNSIEIAKLFNHIVEISKTQRKIFYTPSSINDKIKVLFQYDIINCQLPKIEKYIGNPEQERLNIESYYVLNKKQFEILVAHETKFIKKEINNFVPDIDYTAKDTMGNNLQLSKGLQSLIDENELFNFTPNMIMNYLLFQKWIKKENDIIKPRLYGLANEYITTFDEKTYLTYVGYKKLTEELKELYAIFY